MEIFRRHKHAIDAVLLDNGLSRVSGWEVFLQMKREQPRMRAVIASGQLKPDLQNNMKNAGVNHVIDKPYMLDDLIKVLETSNAAVKRTISGKSLSVHALFLSLEHS